MLQCTMTHTEILELYRYDPETGKLYHRVGRPAVRGHAPVLPGDEVTYGEKVHAKLHGLIWFHQQGYLPTKELDHIDGDRANNRIENLREATHQQNMFNRKIYKNNTAGYPGVHRANKKWAAGITVKGQFHYLGVHTDINDAIAARVAAEARYFGEFAPTKRNLQSFETNGATST